MGPEKGWQSYSAQVRIEKSGTAVARRTPSQLLTILLLKPGVTNPEDVFKNVAALDRYPVGSGRGRVGDLYVSRSSVRTPRWAKLFAGWLEVNQLGVKTASAAAVLLVKRDDRLFAVAFGQGRHLIDPSKIEENFGIQTTLNTIDPARVRTIDRKRFDPISRLTREQASHEVPIFDFGIEPEHDMVRTLTGVPADPALGKRLSGRDSLSAVVPGDLRELPVLLERYLQRYRATTYRNKFPGIDSLTDVRDVVLLDRLEGELVDKLKRRELSRLWLVVPDLLDWTDIEGFKYSLADKAGVHPDIHFESFLESVRDNEVLSIPYLRRRRVFSISASDSTVRGEWPVFRCIYAEIDDPKGTFLLDNGKWYRIDTDLVTQVDQVVKGISVTKLPLPEYRDGETEDQYNKRFAGLKPDLYALMHGKDIRYGGGRSRIEFCDIYTKSRIMVHVKRYGGSSVLSHLFSQGVQGATLLLWDASFRKALNARLPNSHRLKNPDHRPTPDAFEVAYAIATRSAESLELPFFSRVTLRNAYRQLSNFGFKVTCSKVMVG